jgi:carbon storage regulator
MLVLTRKLNEKVHIGGSVTVAVASEFRGKYRLAIEAPRDVQVYREEILPEWWPPARTDGEKVREAAVTWAAALTDEVEAAQLLIRLHLLICAGLGDSPEADAVRDAMDRHAVLLSAGWLAQLSQDLYTLSEHGGRERIANLTAEVEKLRGMHESACARIAEQSELLSRRAEG